jgi:hypothetical protein
MAILTNITAIKAEKLSLNCFQDKRNLSAKNQENVIL